MWMTRELHELQWVFKALPDSLFYLGIRFYQLPQLLLVSHLQGRVRPADRSAL